MIVRSLDDINGTDADVVTENWRSRRIVLARDGVGFSFHETVLYAGTETSMWYANHLNGHERHTVRPKTDFRVLCVFTPPVTGREVHDENGSYPLLTEDATDTD